MIAWSRVSMTRARTVSWALPASVMLVAAVSPFERPVPGSIFGFTLTTVELTIALTLGLGIAAWLKEPASFQWRTPITLPIAAVLVSAFVSATVAPELRASALRVAARLTAAAMLFVLVVNVARSQRIARQITTALLTAAAIVGVIAVLELAQVPWVLNVLKGFRPGFHVVGGQLRATSTLFYPTITAMFREGRVTDAAGEVLYTDDERAHDDVRLDGEPLDPAPGLLIALHKPVGYTCSTKDPGRVVYDLLPPRYRRRDPLL